MTALLSGFDLSVASRGGRANRAASIALSTILVASAAALTSSPAFAQDAGAGVEGSDETGGMTDIIVTGTKKGRGEALQNVPIAATALGEVQLRAQFTPSISDLGSFAPNVNLKADGNSIPGTANFYVRGTGVAGSVPSDDPAVAVVVDGMPLGSNIGVLTDTFDLESVEIYRGPQGTLFGRNATGGAVVLRAKRPTGELGMRAEFTLGNYDTVEAFGSIEAPLANDLSAKVAVLYKDHDGVVRNVTNGGWQGAQNTFLVRPMLRYKNDGGVDITLIGEYGRIKGDGTSNRTRNSDIPGYPSPVGDFETAQNFAGFADVKWRHVIADANFDLAGGVLTSITGYRKLDQASGSDADGLGGTLFHLFANLDQHQFTQELRWSGKVGNLIDLTAGAFYFKQHFDYRERRQIGEPFAPNINIGGGGDIDHRAWAVFAEGSVDLAQGLELVLGGRYTKEKKEAVISVIGGDCPANPDFFGAINFAGCVPSFNGSKSWGNFTPKVGLNYRASPEVFVYASWSRGFRSGGFNVRSTNPDVVPGPYQPEKVDAFEIGSKLDLLNRHLRVNTAVFYNRFTDLQRTAVDNQARQTVLNAAKATIWGVEGEVTAVITPEFTLNANVGYINASYDSYIGIPPGAVRPVKDLWLVDVPEWTVGVNANYSVTLANGSKVTARATYSFTDAVAYDEINTLIEPSHDRVDASLSYATASGFEVSVFGKNLFDTYFNVGAYNIGTTIPSHMSLLPRTYGVRLAYRY